MWCSREGVPRGEPPFIPRVFHSLSLTQGSLAANASRHAESAWRNAHGGSSNRGLVCRIGGREHAVDSLQMWRGARPLAALRRARARRPGIRRARALYGLRNDDLHAHVAAFFVVALARELHATAELARAPPLWERTGPS